MSSQLIVDCENLDGVLGFEILGRKPLPWERLNYSAFRPWLSSHFQQAAQVVAVVREGDTSVRAKHLKFAQALHASGVRVVLAETFAVRNAVCSSSSREVVDHVVEFLIRASRAETIVYGGHDFYAAEALSEQRAKGARVFAAAFPEYVSGEIISVVADVFDIERDIAAFPRPLPRLSFS